MTKPFTLEDWSEWPLDRIIAYMEATDPASWTLDVVRTNDGKNCFYGHLFDMGGGDEQLGGGKLWDYFEECFATTFMLYPVNDGQDPDYQQPTAKERVVAYLQDLRDGNKPTTQQLWAKEDQRYRESLAIPS